MPWTVDYHVTSALFGAATPAASEHFAEQLVQLDGLAWAGRLAPPPKPDGPPMHELDGHHFYAESHLYLVVSSLRVHPDFDATLAQLLTADDAAELIIVEDDSEGFTGAVVQQGIWHEKLLQRFRRSMGARLARRVRVLPQTNSSAMMQVRVTACRTAEAARTALLSLCSHHVSFELPRTDNRLLPPQRCLGDHGTALAQLIRIADVVLDPFPSGNAVATHDAISLATPVVTLPSRQRPGAQYVIRPYLLTHLMTATHSCTPFVRSCSCGPRPLAVLFLATFFLFHF